MNTEDIRTLLAERAAAVDGHEARVGELFDRIRTRRRRRAAAAVAATCGLVLAVVVGASLLAGQPSRISDPASPTASGSSEPRPTSEVSPVRKLAWTDEYWPTRSIHLGDRVIDISDQIPGLPGGRKKGVFNSRVVNNVVHMDMTDDGVAFTMDGRIWFTDGSSVDQIGDLGVEAGQSEFHAVRSGNDGSLVAWFARPGPRRVELVVYDTGLRREVVREAQPGCVDENGHRCYVTAVVGDHIYSGMDERLITDPTKWQGRSLTRLDVQTGRQDTASGQDLAADLANRPRGLVVGDSPATGRGTDGIGQDFARVGAGLRPTTPTYGTRGDTASSPTTAFETGTREQLRLRVPEGYARASQFAAFEWLDDDRLALMADANTWGVDDAGNIASRAGYGDILVCRVSTGRCDLAVKGTGNVRIAPHLPLPG